MLTNQLTLMKRNKRKAASIKKRATKNFYD